MGTPTEIQKGTDKSWERMAQGHPEVTGVSWEIFIIKNNHTRNDVCTYKGILDNRVKNLRPWPRRQEICKMSYSRNINLINEGLNSYSLISLSHRRLKCDVRWTPAPIAGLFTVQLAVPVQDKSCSQSRRPQRGIPALQVEWKMFCALLRLWALNFRAFWRTWQQWTRLCGQQQAVQSQALWPT